MKWIAIGLAAAAFAMAVAAVAFVLATRGTGGEAAPVVVPTVAVAPLGAMAPVVAPVSSKPVRRVARRTVSARCQNGDNSDPTGDDRPSTRRARACRSSSDNQAGDRSSGSDNGSDNQAGDGKRGGA